jgi:hypothetical protein
MNCFTDFGSSRSSRATGRNPAASTPARTAARSSPTEGPWLVGALPAAGEPCRLSACGVRGVLSELHSTRYRLVHLSASGHRRCADSVKARRVAGERLEHPSVGHAQSAVRQRSLPGAGKGTSSGRRALEFHPKPPDSIVPSPPHRRGVSHARWSGFRLQSEPTCSARTPQI